MCASLRAALTATNCRFNTCCPSLWRAMRSKNSMHCGWSCPEHAVPRSTRPFARSQPRRGAHVLAAPAFVHLPALLALAALALHVVHVLGVRLLQALRPGAQARRASAPAHSAAVLGSMILHSQAAQTAHSQLHRRPSRTHPCQAG